MDVLPTMAGRALAPAGGVRRSPGGCHALARRNRGRGRLGTRPAPGLPARDHPEDPGATVGPGGRAGRPAPRTRPAPMGGANPHDPTSGSPGPRRGCRASLATERKSRDVAAGAPSGAVVNASEALAASRSDPAARSDAAGRPRPALLINEATRQVLRLTSGRRIKLDRDWRDGLAAQGRPGLGPPGRPGLGPRAVRRVPLRRRLRHPGARPRVPDRGPRRPADRPPPVPLRGAGRAGGRGEVPDAPPGLPRDGAPEGRPAAGRLDRRGRPSSGWSCTTRSGPAGSSSRGRSRAAGVRPDHAAGLPLRPEPAADPPGGRPARPAVAGEAGRALHAPPLRAGQDPRGPGPRAPLQPGGLDEGHQRAPGRPDAPRPLPVLALHVPDRHAVPGLGRQAPRVAGRAPRGRRPRRTPTRRSTGWSWSATAWAA